MFARVDTRRKATTPLQTFDNSGNGMLNGTYFIRQVLTLTDPNTSAITRAVGLTGTATFDGKGNFNFTGQEVDSTAGGNAKSYTVSGTYAVSASGLLQMTNPVDTTDIDYGGVGGAGEIIASATEGNYDDVLVAIPVGSGGSVQGTYQAGFIDYTMANAANVRDGYFTLTPNGSGSFGNVTVNGAMANQNSTATMQTYPNVTYSFSGNTGTINFPTTPNALTTLITGSKTFAVSSDGNIMVGGSPGGYDLIVGVKSPSSVSNSNFVNTYFTGALENDASGSCGEPSCIDSYYGSYLANGQGAGTQHQRYVAFDFSSFDYTADVAYNFPSNGMYNDGSFEWLMAPNGEAVLQVGTGQYYTLIVAFSAKQYTGNAPFINPDGILNSASFAPITNSIAPGEYVSVFGTGLGSSANAGTLPLPMTLGSAQVSVDSTNSPLLVASATLLNGLVPNSTPAYSFATFQVKANSASSNQVTLYTAATAPGVFTSTSNGIGPADVFHTNYTAVTASSPATAGETVFFYANGLGATNPVVQDGAAAPTNPTAQVSDPNLFVDIFDSAGNYNDATIVSAVLAPGLAGVYQINFTIPSGVASGTGYLELSTTDGYTSMAKISMK
jgi:uncharacterized protein (TIGR03437 family)